MQEIEEHFCDDMQYLLLVSSMESYGDIKTPVNISERNDTWFGIVTGFTEHL
jgi:hypothetical protein